MFGYSTREAAQKLGLSMTTLNKFIASKKIPLPSLVRVGGVLVRLWSDADIAKVRELLPRLANGRTTRHKKPGKKQKPQPGAAVPHEQSKPHKPRKPKKK
jgi:predicted DNA-binding transcriptional regulator AlpA